MTKVSDAAVTTRARRRLRWSRAMPLLFLLPAAILLIGLRVVPIVEAFRLAFTSWDGFSNPVHVGFANFRALAHDPHFRQAVTNNLLLLAAIPIWVVVPYLAALALHAQIRGWRFFRLAFFLPTVFSPVVIGVYYGIVLRPEGPIDAALRAIGLGGLARPWLTDSHTALLTMIGIIIWSSFGIGVLVFLAGLGAVDSELVDAAKVDGARWHQVQRHVVLPALLPVVEFWSILVMIASFTALFPLVYSLTGGGPGYSTYLIDFDIYQQAFESSKLGYASAIGVTLFVAVSAIAALQWLILGGRRRGKR